MTSKINAWQAILSQAFSSITSLCEYLQLDSSELPISQDLKSFPLRVPRHYADLIEKGNPNDPLLRQILPVTDELMPYPGFSADPVGDLAATVSPGVIHKYQGRVLLILTGGCAIHCRYCFRRNFPYSEQQLNKEKLQQAITYLTNHTDVNEVILSGGDPLLLSDDKLAEIFGQLQSIPHISRIRIHSRIPVVLPARITDELLNMMTASNRQLVIVLHANHANELSVEVGAACSRLKAAGVTLLNQSVLLAGVNEDAGILCQLSEALFNFGVLPYYLHMLDHANGTGHFAVTDEKAYEIMQTMRLRLPGFLVPRLVREQAGAGYKLPL